jgi:hypothetical protein
MPSTNNPIRFEAGGVLNINDGTTDYTVVALEPGTVEMQDGGYEPLPYHDRDELQDPYEGAERPSTFKCQVKFSGGTGAADLHKHVVTRDTSTGKMKLYTITVKIPDYKGAITGKQASCAKMFLVARPGIKMGVQFDMLELDMQSSEPNWTWATY